MPKLTPLSLSVHRIVALIAAGCFLAACSSGDPGGAGPAGLVNFAPAADPLPGLGNGFEGTVTGNCFQAQGDVLVTTTAVSTDGGRSWRARPPETGLFVMGFDGPGRALVQSPTGVLLRYTVATGQIESLGRPEGIVVRRPSDGALFWLGHERIFRHAGGETWTPTSGAIPTGYGFRLGFAAGPDGTLYVQDEFRIHASTDGGATWETRGTPPYVPSQPGIIAAADGSVLLYERTDSRRTLLRSTDGARTFQTVNVAPGPLFQGLHLADDGSLVAGPFRSRTHGVTWERMIDYEALGMDSDPNDCVRLTGGQRLYLSMVDEGAFRTDLSASGLATDLEFINGAVSLRDPQTAGDLSVLPGTPLDNGDVLLTSGARYDATRRRWVWQRLPERFSGDKYTLTRLSGGRLALNTGHSVYVSTDHGRTWGPERRVWPAPPIFDGVVQVSGSVIETSDGALYAPSMWRIARYSPQPPPPMSALAVSRDGGATWTPAHVAQNTTEIALVTAASGNTLYATGSSRGPLRSRDGGRTWEASPVEAYVGLPTGEIVHVNSSDPARLLALGTDGSTVRPLGSLRLAGASVRGTLASSHGGARLALDAQGHVWVGCGNPRVVPCRSERPLR